jgi:hypothetical protein
MKERKFSKNQLAEIRAKLMQDGTVFNYHGHSAGSFTMRKTEFTSDIDPIYAIGRPTLFGASMNVNKFGPTCVTVYSYDMLGNKTVGKFRYDLIEFVKEEA